MLEILSMPSCPLDIRTVLRKIILSELRLIWVEYHKVHASIATKSMQESSTDDEIEKITDPQRRIQFKLSQARLPDYCHLELCLKVLYLYCMLEKLSIDTMQGSVLGTLMLHLQPPSCSLFFKKVWEGWPLSSSHIG